ncbi:hypothetical protein [Leptospira alstonii]|nr:hypothetical protein [Leptospira alstonii]
MNSAKNDLYPGDFGFRTNNVVKQIEKLFFYNTLSKDKIEKFGIGEVII